MKTIFLLLILSIAHFTAAWSQTHNDLAPPIYPTINGRTLSHIPVRLSDHKGKVVIVYFWSTACAVCLDTMNEIRMNTAGWSDKPLITMAINLNKNRADFDNYIYTLTALGQTQPQLIHMYGAEKQYQDTLGAKSKMLQTFVIDTKGRLAASYHGRIPAKAWDDIADLLP